MISYSEFNSQYYVEKLITDIQISDFDCGDEDLNDFIMKEIHFYRNQRLAMPYIVTKKNQSDKILAYFTLANDKINVTDFATNSQFNKFRKANFNKEKYLRSYPSVKIGRFAISKELQGEGIGTYLLTFIKMFFLADNKTGCRFITLDAYRGAVDFYKRNGFSFLQKEDKNPTQLMYFDLMTINSDSLI